MQGSIVQINIGLGGLPKYPVPAARIAPLGLEGDAHRNTQIHGGPMKAVLLMAAETIEALAARGYPVYFGATGENLTTRGLDYRHLRIGDQLRAGGAVLEVTRPRSPCANLDIYGKSLRTEIYDDRVAERDPSSPRWGMSGLYAAVRLPGPVKTGDIIAVVATLA